MEFVYDIVVITHLLGMAAVIGAYAARQPVVSGPMVWGARLQIVTGLILVGMAESIDSLGKDPNMVKIGVKLVVAIAVAAFAEMGYADHKRGKSVPWFAHAAGALAVVNVFVAVLWS
ncbi:hypothetical protein ACL02S_02890 [Nocardia sp. 004]|uniref:hypothetical protein n=1 Tax=Nocardia sp. 004 TaxID=3385978 RepID=UPI00399F3036